MLKFIIYAIIAGILIGPVFGALFIWIYCTYEEQRTKLIAMIICMIVTGVITSSIICSQDSIWNDGYCDCGNKWQFVDAYAIKGWSYYVYECPNCSNTIKVQSWITES